MLVLPQLMMDSVHRPSCHGTQKFLLILENDKICGCQGQGSGSNIKECEMNSRTNSLRWISGPRLYQRKQASSWLGQEIGLHGEPRCCWDSTSVLLPHSPGTRCEHGVHCHRAGRSNQPRPQPQAQQCSGSLSCKTWSQRTDRGPPKIDYCEHRRGV